jgi:muconolactone delta-isomerase
MQILMIARLKPDTPVEKFLPLLKPEAAKTWEFLKQGQIRQTWYLTSEKGVVFLWEAESVETVEQALHEYPMHQADLLDVQLLPLGPYTALEGLFS